MQFRASNHYLSRDLPRGFAYRVEIENNLAFHKGRSAHHEECYMIPDDDTTKPHFFSSFELDAVCDQFENEWKSGNPPKLESYLDQVAESDCSKLFTELLQIELWWRREENPPVSIDEYKRRFPNQTKEVDTAFHAFSAGRRADSLAETDNKLRSTISTSEPADPDITLTFSVRHADGHVAPILNQQLQRGLDASFHSGIVIDGRYVLKKELGRGGMGVVFLATDSRLHRDVAIKVILQRESGAEEESSFTRAQFEKEARLGAALIQPAIATVFDYGFHDGKPYTVFEYVPGETLRDVLNRRKRLTLEEVRLVVPSLAKALDQAHSQHIVHRDLKPENIRVTEQGQFKILDLGLAKRFSGKEDWRFSGTPAYASPEQCLEQPSDGRTDQYSLAVIIFEMLTGARPFQAKNWRQLLEMHANEAPPILEEPEEVADALQRAMSKNPTERFPSCESFAAGLGCVFLGQGSSIAVLDEAEVQIGSRRKNLLWARDGIPSLMIMKSGCAVLTDQSLWISCENKIFCFHRNLLHEVRLGADRWEGPLPVIFAFGWLHRKFNGPPILLRRDLWKANRTLALTIAEPDQEHWLYVAIRFKDRPTLERWSRAIFNFRRAVAEHKSDIAQPPLALLSHRPKVQHQVLGPVDATHQKSAIAKQMSALKAAATGADAVAELTVERVFESGVPAMHAMGMAVRAVDSNGRETFQGRWLADEMRDVSRSLVVFIVAVSLLCMFFPAILMLPIPVATWKLGWTEMLRPLRIILRGLSVYAFLFFLIVLFVSPALPLAIPFLLPFYLVRRISRRVRELGDYASAVLLSRKSRDVKRSLAASFSSIYAFAAVVAPILLLIVWGTIREKSENYIAKGDALLEAGEFPEAAAVYSEVIETGYLPPWGPIKYDLAGSPDVRTNALTQRAICLRVLGEPQRAIDDLTSAINRDLATRDPRQYAHTL